jgi:hypothetical protein
MSQLLPCMLIKTVHIELRHCYFFDQFIAPAAFRFKFGTRPFRVIDGRLAFDFLVFSGPYNRLLLAPFASPAIIRLFAAALCAFHRSITGIAAHILVSGLRSSVKVASRNFVAHNHIQNIEMSYTSITASSDENVVGKVFSPSLL